MLHWNTLFTSLYSFLHTIHLKEEEDAQVGCHLGSFGATVPKPLVEGGRPSLCQLLRSLRAELNVNGVFLRRLPLKCPVFPQVLKCGISFDVAGSLEKALYPQVLQASHRVRWFTSCLIFQTTPCGLTRASFPQERELQSPGTQRLGGRPEIQAQAWPSPPAPSPSPCRGRSQALGPAHRSSEPQPQLRTRLCATPHPFPGESGDRAKVFV